MNFCRGDRVIVENNLMGTVVEEWIRTSNCGATKEPYYKVYVDYFKEIREYNEEVIQRCLIRHKFLSGEEIVWQDNAVNNRIEVFRAYNHSEEEINEYKHRRRFEYRVTLFNNEVLPILKNSKYYDKEAVFVRTCNCLRRADICTVNEIVNLTPAKMKAIRNLGKVSIKYIVDTFRDYVEKNNITDEIITLEDYGV